VKVIAPTHGLVITDMDKTVAKVSEGIIAASLTPEVPVNSSESSTAKT
jgi:hypothetical protein